MTSIAITGASGLIGRALTTALRADGVDVRKLVRREAVGADEFRWDPVAGQLDRSALRGVGAVVHLAGAPIGQRRWSLAEKRRILDSRVQGTALIARSVAACETRPVLVSCSAVGFYGDTAELVDESSPRGAGFLAEVCDAWECAAEPARAAGVRVVHPRLGLILAGHGGVLRRMLPAFKLGAGAVLGTGKQGFAWVSLADAVRALRYVIEDETLSGAVNVVAPGRVDNEEFTRALADALNRPALFRAPQFALRAGLGAMADELLLWGQFVAPARLTARGFEFEYPELSEALAAMLG
jgi:uncharacterized protein (TIGR01777 family)